MRHHIETKRVRGLNPGFGHVRIRETDQPLEAYLDAKSAEGWEVVSVAPIGHLEVLITYRRQ